MRTVGITTTVPVEVLLAAGYKPVDLNNVFIGDPDPDRLVNIAERSGFPQNCCTWIKGIFGVCLDRDIDTVICVTTGDCSNTIMLMEVLRLKGFRAMMSVQAAGCFFLMSSRCKPTCRCWPMPWTPPWKKQKR